MTLRVTADRDRRWAYQVNRFALVLLLLPLASCDVFYGFVRHVDVDPGFDADALQVLVGQHPDSSSEFYAWDGEVMHRLVQRGRAQALVGYRDRHLSLSSMWTGRLPEQAVIDASNQLQGELIELMRSSFPDLPSLPDWATVRVRMDAQLDDAADEASPRS